MNTGREVLRNFCEHAPAYNVTDLTLSFKTNMDIDDTQVLVLSDSYQSDDDNSQERKLVAHLKVYQQKELSETLYPVYEGMLSKCALSKEHACIIVRGENHLIYDKTSRNKTRKGKLFLKPDVRYSLEDGDEITFADIRCSYIYLKTPHDNEETDNNLGDSPLKSSNNNNNPSQDESVHYELDEEELSSDILQPTQAGGLLGPLYHPSQATQLYVADSEDENQTAMNNENPAYIPNSDQSDAELETKKDKIEESTLQYELITGKNKDNVFYNMSCPHFCTDDPTGEITSNTDIVLYFKILVWDLTRVVNCRGRVSSSIQEKVVLMSLSSLLALFTAYDT
ncbi:hypothetical protein LSH36_357g00000 [Paralvinella palmiformis]|uniref:FHA domain-containing protein n=1 Tax=Paralvinella palmiformis TaxID=53620 RepID=A0AAD9N143_9ANNE|nr:hypothetical protein LSH36_357g00000 [Paralvinella palmiformis]